MSICIGGQGDRTWYCQGEATAGRGKDEDNPYCMHLILLALPAGVAGPKAQASDEAAIEKSLPTLLRHGDDAKSMASYWAVDGDVITPTARRANGRAEIEKMFADEHATSFQGHPHHFQ